MHCASSTDLSLFDELENLGDADDLLEALENGGSVSNYSVIMQMTDDGAMAWNMTTERTEWSEPEMQAHK